MRVVKDIVHECGRYGSSCCMWSPKAFNSIDVGLSCRIVFFFPHYIYHVVDHQTCQKKYIWNLGICYSWFFWEDIFGYDCQRGHTKYLTPIHVCGRCKLFATPPDFVNWRAFWATPRLKEDASKVWLIFWVGVWEVHTKRTPKVALIWVVAGSRLSCRSILLHSRWWLCFLAHHVDI